MKLIARWASDGNRREEWTVETVEDLFDKAREYGDIILYDPSEEQMRDCQIMVYDSYIE